MKTKDILEQLERIRQERFLEAHHDSYDLHQPDLDALDCAISLLNILDESNPNDEVMVGELMAASNIDR
ncbi:MAG: hypothetical protein IKI76_10455 [Selenomonadaceae bacterium]|nr:hypothetical protein [Selenomonadaceae bacterium]MBR6713396.1 hypothetical protein [Selenomonadaceae bacterium]